MNDFSPPAHIALTVGDISVSREWYKRLLGLDPIIDHHAGLYEEVVFLFPNGFVMALHSFPDGRKDAFDERRTGLDHLAFNVSSRADLDTWEKRLDEMGIEHGKIVDTPDGSALAFRDPDNIQLEFWANP